MRSRNIAADIAARVIAPRPDCQIWTGATDRGYGRISVDGVVKRVHRVAWEMAFGEILEGMTIDHLCHVKACVNIDHLELVSREENARRGTADFLQRKKQRFPRVKRTHCPAGHEMTPDNQTFRAFTNPDYAECKTCCRTG